MAFFKKPGRPVRKFSKKKISAATAFAIKFVKAAELKWKKKAAALRRQCSAKYGQRAEPVFERLTNDFSFNSDALQNLLVHGPEKVAAALDARGAYLHKFGKDALLGFNIESYCELYPHLAKARALPGEVVKQTFIFHGNVQDVGFRYMARTFACAAGLKCIEAENWGDGSVHVTLKGPANYQEAVLNGLKEMFKVSKITRE